MSASPSASPQSRRIRVAIVGAGFSGIAMALEMKRAGFLKDVTIIDKAEEFGGTWRDNVYPGCACDIPSHLYSLAGEPYDWPAFYSHQPAILDYILHVVDKHDLRSRALLGSAVTRQEWDDAQACWVLTLQNGQTIPAEVVVNGVGPLSRPIIPDIPGRSTFRGPMFHSAEWDVGTDIAGKRVGIIGTGASAVQIAPAIAEDVQHLSIFQRTPSWVMPKVERTFSPIERRILRHVPGVQSLLREVVFNVVEHVVWRVLAQGRLAQKRAVRLGMWNIHRSITDPDLRQAVTPSLIPGCKRIMFSNTWYPTLARPNVDLHTSGISEITPTGVLSQDGNAVHLDVLVYGTGFDAHHFWFPMEVLGQGGRELEQHWSTASAAHMSTTTPGFPNMFFLLGPNTGTGHNSVVLMAEAQAKYVMGALEFLRSGAAAWLAPGEQSAELFGEEMAARHADLVWASGCGSWYLNQSGVNDTLYPGRVRDFQRRLARFDIEAYKTGSDRPVAWQPGTTP
ncbi:MAG: flavin-containing monooxygenase [Euzebya sp.]